MTPYTVADTPAVVQRIDADLATVRDVVAEGDPQMVSLILTGGFARGEGAVRNGSPQNDYDLVVVRRLGDSRPYPEMRDELERRLGLHIDLAPVWIHRLRFAEPSIFWYETALRGRTLAGQDVLDRIPVRSVTGIAPGEGIRLLCNRAAGLLLASDPSDDDRRIQASKALLGAMDAELLSRSIFPPSQTERWEAYQSLDAESRQEMPPRRWLEWAIAFKTRPDDARNVPAQDAWVAAADAVLSAVPGALQAAGCRDLDQYARQGSVLDLAFYQWRIRGSQARRWVRHPAHRVRVETLRLLEQARAGHPLSWQRPMAPGDPLQSLKTMRAATLQ